MSDCKASPATAGKPSGYQVHGCRCEACTAAATAVHRKYMTTHPEARKRQREYMRRYRKGYRARA